VGFPKRPKSVDELKKWLFGNDDYVTYYDYAMSTWEVAARVFKDIKSQKRPATKAKIIEEINSGYFKDRPPYDYNRTKPSDLVKKEFKEKFPNDEIWGDKKPTDPEALALIDKHNELALVEWDEVARKCKEAAENYYNTTLTPKFEGKKVFVFSYADDGGEAVMEHGDIFHNLPHAQISHH
jgi:hypothetical protein